MILTGNVSIIFFAENTDKPIYKISKYKGACMKYLIRKPDTFMNTLNEEINTILKRSFDSVFPEYVLNKETNGLTIPVDIKEFENDYKVRVEVPGVKKKDIDIELNKSYMKISAKKEEEKEEKTKKYHKTEFAYGNYSRTIYFPQEINIADSHAHLDNGILRLDLPKLKAKEEETKKIEVK